MTNFQQTLSTITDYIKADIFPGASLALYDGQDWQEHYLGTQDGNHPVVPGLTYDLASVSKVVGVGTLCLFYLQAGKLDLDEKLSTYYPEVVDKTLTLRQLLSHSSGIDPFIPNRDDLDQEGLIAAINAIKVKTDKPFLYTDINFILLGLMLEKLSGQTLDKLLTPKFSNRLVCLKHGLDQLRLLFQRLRGFRVGLFMIPRLEFSKNIQVQQASFQP